MNPFGLPLEAADWADLLALIGDDVAVGAADHERVAAAAARDLSVAVATGRWRFGEQHREPDRMVAGDIPAMRGQAALSLTGDAADGRYSPWVEGAAPAGLILTAPPYWLGAGATSAVLDSTPPGEQPELGCPVTVWFQQPLDVPAVSFPAHLATIMDLGSDPDGPQRRRLRAGAERSIRTLWSLSQAPGRGKVRGVLLGQGKAADLVGWIVEVPAADGDAWPAREVMFARRSLSAWRSILDVIAAIVAWGDWTEPDSEIPAAPDRQWLRRLRYGSTRRDEQAGKLAGVRVLDARRRARPASARASSIGTHASPVPHLRTGHFRQQLHGPRDDPWHETVWIPPTLVNPDGDWNGPVTVWRLPDPP